MAGVSDDVPSPSDYDARFSERANSSVYSRENSTFSQHDRRLITVAYLVALNRSTELPFHIGAAFENGFSRQEIIEPVAQVQHTVPALLDLETLPDSTLRHRFQRTRDRG